MGRGEVPGKRSLPGSCSSQPLRQLPASERERFPAAGSSCQRFLPPPDAAALTQPVGRPLPRPFCPGAIVCELGGVGGGSTLPRGELTAVVGGAGAKEPERGWSPGPGSCCGRRRAAQLLTTHCPPPTSLPSRRSLDHRCRQLSNTALGFRFISRALPGLGHFLHSYAGLPTPGAALLLFFSSF